MGGGGQGERGPVQRNEGELFCYTTGRSERGREDEGEGKEGLDAEREGGSILQM